MHHDDSRRRALRDLDEDVAQRAVAELIASGLLHGCGEAVLPSRAALRFDALGL